MIIDDEGGFAQVPAFTQQTIDRVGAGDAFFAVTAMAAALEASSELVGFLGNVAGSLAVKMIGNQKTVDRQAMTAFINYLYTGSVC